MWTSFQSGPSGIIDKIYDASLDAERWSDVLVDVADATGSAGGVFYRMAPHRRQVVGRSIGRLDPDLCKIYEMRHFVNPWSGYMFAQPAGRHVVSDEILPLSGLQRSPFYNEVLAPLDVAHASMIPLLARPDHVIAFTICRSAARGPFEQSDRAKIDPLLPHLRRAAQIAARVDGSDSLKEGAMAALDCLAAGVVVLDRRGRVLLANRSAICSMSHGELLLRDGIFTARQAVAGVNLKQLLLNAIGGGSGGAMLLTHDTDALLPLSLLVAPVRGRLRLDADAGRLGGAAAIVFIRDPNHDPDTGVQSLAALFGLTNAEARVALVLFGGDDFASAATTLRISINTLKTHAKRIFAKMGVNRHAQFVRRFADFAPVTINSDRRP